MICVAWMRNKERRLYLSTATTVPVTEEKYKPKGKRKSSEEEVRFLAPSVSIQYNRGMWAVDTANQYAAKNAPGRRSKRYWLSIVLHYFHVAVVNAYLLYSTYGHESLPKIDFPQFRDALGEALVDGFTAGRETIGRPPNPTTSKHSHVQSDFDPARGRRTQGRCTQCVKQIGPRGNRKQTGHQTTRLCAECTAASSSTTWKAWVCDKDPKCWHDHCRSIPHS